MSEITAIKGFADLFSPDSDAFTFMENTARDVFFRYGYCELRTPLVEHTGLFNRGIGEGTDVVQKEMYTFADRKGRSLTLRPEATAGVMRAFIESGRSGDAVHKFFTCGPMFRYERPQKGRMRQFHQINCECLGPSEPYADAELVTMVMRFLDALGIKNLSLQLNTLGCAACRPAYHKALTAWLSEIHAEELCEDCAKRRATNPLRVLDCKVPSCRELTAEAPRLWDHVCSACREHFETVTRLLEKEHVPYVINHRLVRGLDYYVRTTFEVVSKDIGAQGAVAGGGRYDGLVAQLGGPNIPGLGFACGMERLAMLLPAAAPRSTDFYIAVLTDEAREAAFALAQALRDAGFRGEMGFAARSAKSALRQAGKAGAVHALLLGHDELVSGSVTIKHMSTGEQHNVPSAQVAGLLRG